MMCESIVTFPSTQVRYNMSRCPFTEKPTSFKVAMAPHRFKSRRLTEKTSHLTTWRVVMDGVCARLLEFRVLVLFSEVYMSRVHYITVHHTQYITHDTRR